MVRLQKAKNHKVSLKILKKSKWENQSKQSNNRRGKDVTADYTRKIKLNRVMMMWSIATTNPFSDKISQRKELF